MNPTVDLRDVSTHFAPDTAYNILRILAWQVGVENVRFALDEIEIEQHTRQIIDAPSALPDER